MKVLNLIQKPQRRGAETFACDLSWWLRRNGHEARVVSLYRHVGPSPHLDRDDRCLGGHESGLLERVFDPGLVVSLIRQIREFQPDVVQCNGGRTVKYGAIARGAAPKALWVYRNIDSPRFWLRSRFARTMMPTVVRAGFDAAVGVSVTTLAEVHASYGFEGASATIENGVDFERLSIGADRKAGLNALAAGSKRILWVGALGPQKRPDVAVELMSRLPADVSLTMLGEGPWRDRVSEMVRSKGLEARVRLGGNRSDVGDVMRAADMLVMTSDSEGIPAVVIEAQHCGLPVVAFDVGGLKECVPADGPGKLVPHGDVDALAAAVIAEGERARRDETRAACTAYADRFSIDRIGPRYLAFYEEQLTRRRCQ